MTNKNHIYIPFPSKEDTSEITLRCRIEDYSGSRIARAVEDADAHLLDLHAEGADEGDTGELQVTLRVGHADPMAAVRSLERYGYEVETTSAPHSVALQIATERLLALQTLLGV